MLNAVPEVDRVLVQLIAVPDVIPICTPIKHAYSSMSYNTLVNSFILIMLHLLIVEYMNFIFEPLVCVIYHPMFTYILYYNNITI